MANYISKFTGQQIESKLDLLESDNFKAYLEELGIRGATTEEISQAVENYFAEHPITGVTQEDIQNAVNSYLGEHPVSDGQNGSDGVGISSISKTSTSGLVDTYTITFTDGNTTTFAVTNGKDGESGSGTVTDEKIASAVQAYLSENPIDVETNEWKNKKCAFLGDSITEGVGTTKTYHSYLKDMIGIEAHSYGVNGALMSDLYSQATTMNSELGNDVDAIFVFAGTNNFFGGTELGEFFSESTETINVTSSYTEERTKRSIISDTSTFKGSINYVLGYLRTNFPYSQIIVMTPIHRAYATFGATNIQQSELYQNKIGLYFEKYIDALREACDIWSIPCIDLYKDSGLFPLYSQYSDYFHDENTDMLHPNANGHKRIAEVICSKLNSIAVGFDKLGSSYQYIVTKSATNCVIAGYDTVTNGSSYSATITANEGYVLGYITVTMGGNDITSSAYSDGNISISSATGDIVITATAIEESQIVNATSITLSPTEISFDTVGDTSTITATLQPSNTTDTVVSWESDNQSVATVNNGVITSVANGSTTITATTSNGLIATVTVNVNISSSSDFIDVSENLTVNNISNANGNPMITDGSYKTSYYQWWRTEFFDISSYSKLYYEAYCYSTSRLYIPPILLLDSGYNVLKYLDFDEITNKNTVAQDTYKCSGELDTNGAKYVVLNLWNKNQTSDLVLKVM